MNREELSNKLNIEGYEPSLYSLYGDLEADRIIIYENYDKWEIFYLDERGVRHMLTICHSEEKACDYLYNCLRNNVLLQASKFFSRQPEYLAHTAKLINKIELPENTTQVWFDSIIKNEKNLPYYVKAVIFELEYSEQEEKYIVRFFGSKKTHHYKGCVSFTVDFIPFHEYMLVKWPHKQIDFENEFSNILRKYVLNKDTAVYGDFFEGRILCVGFRDNIHKLQLL